MKLDHLIALARDIEGPAPLAVDKANHRLFSGCGNKVMAVTDADRGKAVESVTIGGDPDGIIYDAGTEGVFLSLTATAGGRSSGRRDPTPTQSNKRSKSTNTQNFALDPKTHRVFSSTADLVWPPAVPGKKHLPNARPGTFRLLVVSQL